MNKTLALIVAGLALAGFGDTLPDQVNTDTHRWARSGSVGRNDYVLTNVVLGNVKVALSNVTNANGTAVTAGSLNAYTKTETDAKIAELAPPEGNYATVSNKAMTALQSFTEQDPTFSTWYNSNGYFGNLYALDGDETQYTGDEIVQWVVDDSARIDELENAGYISEADAKALKFHVSSITNAAGTQISYADVGAVMQVEGKNNAWLDSKFHLSQITNATGGAIGASDVGVNGSISVIRPKVKADNSVQTPDTMTYTPVTSKDLTTETLGALNSVTGGLLNGVYPMFTHVNPAMSIGYSKYHNMQSYDPLEPTTTQPVMFSVGAMVHTKAQNAITMGYGANNTNNYSFIWSGDADRQYMPGSSSYNNAYGTKYNGGFHINPKVRSGMTDPIENFWIGEKNVKTWIEEKAPVTSVNGKSGTVSLTAGDVGALSREVTDTRYHPRSAVASDVAPGTVQIGRGLKYSAVQTTRSLREMKWVIPYVQPVTNTAYVSETEYQNRNVSGIGTIYTLDEEGGISVVRPVPGLEMFSDLTTTPHMFTLRYNGTVIITDYWFTTSVLQAVVKSRQVEVDMFSDYSVSKSYSYGQVCLKDGVEYRCSASSTSPEAWNPAHWTLVCNVSDVRTNGVSAVVGGVVNITIPSPSALSGITSIFTNGVEVSLSGTTANLSIPDDNFVKSVVTTDYIRNKLGVYLYVGVDGGIYVHTEGD